MAKRRPSGDGMVRKREDGRWEGRIVIGHKEKGGRLVTGDTKTYAGTRTIVLPDSTAELLRCRKKNSYSVWIFPNPLKPEAPMNPSIAYRQLKAILKMCIRDSIGRGRRAAGRGGLPWAGS